jgi:hypothetical protein
MALSPEEIIETICPELSGIPSLPVYQEMAVEIISQGFYGKMYNMALAYQACHYFTITGDSEGGGGSGDAAAGIFPIASKSEGGLSVTYAIPSQTDSSSDLESTKYGKLLLALKKGRPKMGVNMAGTRLLGGLR